MLSLALLFLLPSGSFTGEIADICMTRTPPFLLTCLTRLHRTSALASRQHVCHDADRTPVRKYMCRCRDVTHSLVKRIVLKVRRYDEKQHMQVTVRVTADSLRNNKRTNLPSQPPLVTCVCLQPECVAVYVPAG